MLADQHGTVQEAAQNAVSLKQKNYLAALLHLQAGAMLAVPRTAEPLSWHGKQLAEMQPGSSRAPMEAQRDGGAQRLDAYASPRRPAEAQPCDAECGRLETLGGVGLCVAVNCPLRETHGSQPVARVRPPGARERRCLSPGSTCALLPSPPRLDLSPEPRYVEPKAALAAELAALHYAVGVGIENC